MSFELLQSYWPALLIAVFFAWRFLKFKRVRSLIPVLVSQGAVIIDVRSREEFKSGSNPQSINIPLSEIGTKAHELDRKKAVVLCCASGARSGMAAGVLRGLGFKDVVNAGPWTNTLIART